MTSTHCSKMAEWWHTLLKPVSLGCKYTALRFRWRNSSVYGDQSCTAAGLQFNNGTVEVGHAFTADRQVGGGGGGGAAVMRPGAGRHCWCCIWSPRFSVIGFSGNIILFPVSKVAIIDKLQDAVITSFMLYFKTLNYSFFVKKIFHLNTVPTETLLGKLA